MQLFDILRGVEYELLQGSDKPIKSITIDSRMATEGTLFICIQGLRSDGHEFIPAAAEQGAAAVLVDREVEAPEGMTVVRVKHSRTALAYAAANYHGRPADSLQIIGVTGTKGKTSSTYYLESVLKENGFKTGVIGTVETRVGDKPLAVYFAAATTPDALELQQILSIMRDEGATHVVMEVSSHALELEKVEGIRFRAAVFTNLTHDHLEFHGTMENYRNAKAKLFDRCEHGIVNVDSEAGAFMLERGRCPYTTFGIEKESDLRAFEIAYLDEGVSFHVMIDGKDEAFFVPVKGKFTVYNTLGVIGAALALDISPDTIRTALQKIKGVPGRLQSVENNKGIHVIVDYAHTPDSLVNIITTVREFTEGKVYTVFGCGGDRDKTKRPVMGRIVGELSDGAVITSDNPRTEDPGEIIRQIEEGMKGTNCPYSKEADRREGIRKGIEMAQKGDAVIIAGKGHENYQMFAELTIHFDDVEVATEILESLS